MSTEVTIGFPNMFNCESRQEAEIFIYNEVEAIAETRNSDKDKEEKHLRYLTNHFKYNEFYRCLAGVCIGHFVRSFNDITGSHEVLTPKFVQMVEDNGKEAFCITMPIDQYRRWYEIASRYGNPCKNPFERIINGVEYLADACEDCDIQYDIEQNSNGMEDFLDVSNYQEFLDSCYGPETEEE